ncbi:NAD(P)-dependent oxidoreductase [Microbacterium panaciterrae]|uniref:NAD(P)-dependent oxidoreductase n=1 Tax=Microbacterium panaciterrae TaxID=985759 RepID=A0ABP8PDT5_9MICO
MTFAPPDVRGERVSVIGVGTMGTAIASQLITRGARVTIWNRSPGKYEPLVAAGAIAASTFDEAIEASPLAISCLINSSVAQSLLAERSATRSLNGRTFVDTSTASPTDVQQLGDLLGAAGGKHLDAKLMFYPAQVGSSSATIFVSGSPELYSRFQSIFENIVGDVRFIGHDPRRASILYTAVWSYYYAGLFGFLEGLALVTRSGIEPTLFLDQVRASSSDLIQHLRETAERISEDRLEGDQAAVEIYTKGFQTMIDTYDEVGIPSRMLEPQRALSAFARDKGYGRADIAAVTRALLDTSEFPITAHGRITSN